MDRTAEAAPPGHRRTGRDNRHSLLHSSHSRHSRRRSCVGTESTERLASSEKRNAEKGTYVDSVSRGNRWDQGRDYGRYRGGGGGRSTDSPKVELRTADAGNSYHEDKSRDRRGGRSECRGYESSRGDGGDRDRRRSDVNASFGGDQAASCDRGQHIYRGSSKPQYNGTESTETLASSEKGYGSEGEYLPGVRFASSVSLDDEQTLSPVFTTLNGENMSLQVRISMFCSLLIDCA
jgi:hypothetical protein